MSAKRVAIAFTLAVLGCSPNESRSNSHYLEANPACEVHDTSGSTVALPSTVVERIRGLPHWTPGEADLPTGESLAATVHLSIQVNGDQELSFLVADQRFHRSITGHVPVNGQLTVGAEHEMSASFAPTGPTHAAAQLSSFATDGSHFLVPIEEVSIEVEPTGFYSMTIQVGSLERFPPSTDPWTNAQLEVANAFNNEQINFVGRLTAACVDVNPATGELARVMDVSAEQECASFMQHL